MAGTLVFYAIEALIRRPVSTTGAGNEFPGRVCACAGADVVLDLE